ncbi:MAG: hypothetical protein AAB463_00805 [Patescibacteria group bacterium]
MSFFLRKYVGRIERIAWYAWCALVPMQLRWVLWSADWYFVEWRSAFFYASDVLFLVVFVLWLLRVWRTRSSLWRASDKALLAVLLWALVGTLWADSMGAALYAWLRLVQGAGIYVMVRSSIGRYVSGTRTACALAIGVSAQAVIAVAQFILQHDIGLRIFGETLLAPGMFGVASFFVGDVPILRAYGTFPHANVLAVWMLLALCIAMGLSRFSRSWLLGALAALWTWAYALSFSRTAWFAGAVIALGMLLMKKAHLIPRALVWGVGLGAVSIFLLFPQHFLTRARIDTGEEAVRLRAMYIRESVNEASHHPLSFSTIAGVGIGQYTTWLAGAVPFLPRQYYQPAHSVPILVFSELGVIGSMLVIWWLVRVGKELASLRRNDYIFWGVCAIVLLLALFDHFFWTIHQGRVVFWLLLGVFSTMHTHWYDA